MELEMRHKKISELVEQDFIHAHVLYYFGIPFYENPSHTLEQACQAKGIEPEVVIRNLIAPDKNFQEADLPLYSFPMDLILEYLKHSHHLFLRHKLPYIHKLVQHFKADHPDYLQVEKDLKVLFPLFMEDFIHHIYEEEDTLFRHIGFLARASKGVLNPTRLYYAFEKISLKKFANEHESHDDEMEGIRRITKDYLLTPGASLHVKVIYAELQGFEKDLKAHARIENEILFPKALLLESKVKSAFFEKTKLN
jgi:regulator of cell morphogenesis and NO signaling